MGKITGKRVSAYLIDIIIIYLIVALFSSIEILNPSAKKYEKAQKEYTNLYSEYMLAVQNGSSGLEETERQLTNINYDLSKYGASIIIVGLAASILYFVVFEYYNKGQTIGKKILKIKVLTNDNKRPSFKKIASRSIIKYNLLTGSSIIVGVIVLLLLGFTSKSFYIKYAIIIQSFDMAFAGATLLFMMFRKDGKGLHDIISGTQVCKVETAESIKEAEYIENEVKEEAPKKIAKKRSAKKETK
jgi:uncharacterized RDD family membrane protein YckC